METAAIEEEDLHSTVNAGNRKRTSKTADVGNSKKLKLSGTVYTGLTQFKIIKENSEVYSYNNDLLFISQLILLFVKKNP